MSDCQHPRSQHYVDGQDRLRCAACGDIWDQGLYDGTGGFRPLTDSERDPSKAPSGARLERKAAGCVDAGI